ncbi:transcriptional regulator [Psychrobacillus sp. BM2]|uniref:transcriptional regulator n=1 Tax=Psychrobacillus sp. BM2 TaxID=3400421 RepID=UPI003B027108
MRINLMKCMERNQLVELIYLDSNGNMSKRQVKVLKIQGDTFQAFCFKRNAKRTFIMENVLAFVPVSHKERAVI